MNKNKMYHCNKHIIKGKVQKQLSKNIISNFCTGLAHQSSITDILKVCEIFNKCY